MRPSLASAIHVTLKHRNENYPAWEAACRRFHAEYDSLAFPGGLSQAFARLGAGDPEIIEQVVQFLEADPYYFRSGYHKVEMIKQLCRRPLSPDHKKRLQQVVLSQIRDHDKREFRAYCRLATHIVDPEFQKQIADMASASRALVPRHARWVLEYLKLAQNQKSRTPHLYNA